MLCLHSHYFNRMDNCLRRFVLSHSNSIFICLKLSLSLSLSVSLRLLVPFSPTLTYSLSRSIHSRTHTIKHIQSLYLVRNENGYKRPFINKIDFKIQRPKHPTRLGKTSKIRNCFKTREQDEFPIIGSIIMLYIYERTTIFLYYELLVYLLTPRSQHVII